MARTRNTGLTAVIKELGWSQQQVADRFVRVAAEMGAVELLGTQRSHVSMWVLGTQPTGRAGHVLCEALSRGLNRPVSPEEIGLAVLSPTALPAPDWHGDTLRTLNELGRTELNPGRRWFLQGSVYSLAALALPGQAWWQHQSFRARVRDSSATRRIGRSDLEAVQDMTAFFQRRDQRRGGGHGRSTVVAYLTDEVTEALNASFPDERLRRDFCTAAGELVYLNGWMAFDAGHHAIAQRYFLLATKLAAEAENPALAAHILRAMAHQALDLDHRRPALELAAAAMESERYSHAGPRERALLGVVHARALAADGDGTKAARALLRAEDDLRAAGTENEEPDRVFFFGEASLAHETACTLRTLGDLTGAQHQFHRSVRHRGAAAFARTHAVTLGYLGALHVRRGEIEAACETWARALDSMEGVRSGRARGTVVDMRRTIAALRYRGSGALAELDARAAAILRPVP